MIKEELEVMDFLGMKRRNLQALSKRHEIPANLKNTEMACRLASLLEKEREEIVKEKKKLPEGIEEDNLVFGRVVKKRRQSGIAVRRSTRITAKVVNVAESSENELNKMNEIVETEKAKRIGSSCRTQEDECRVLEFEDAHISKGLSGKNQGGFKFGEVKRRSTRFIAKQPKELVEDELEVQDTGKYQDLAVESVRRRSRRFLDVQTNAQDRRKSMRLKASVANSSMGVETKESNTLQSKISLTVSSQEGELVKNKRNVQDESQVEKAPRRSKRLGNHVTLLMDENDKYVNQSKRTYGNDCEDKKLPRRSKRIALDNFQLLKTCSVTNNEPVGASVDEHSIAEEEMKISKVACMSDVPCENLTTQKLFDTNTQLEPEEATSYSKKMKFEKEKPQGMAEDSLSTSETKAVESFMICENEMDSTSGNISLVRNKQESSCELLEQETEEKMEQDTVLMVVTEDKDIASTVVSEEDITTKGEILASVSRSELKEDSFVAKIAEAKEGNLMVMEQLSQNGKICTAQSLPHHYNEVVESGTVTEKILLMGDSALDVAEKEDDHTATEIPDEEINKGDNIIEPDEAENGHRENLDVESLSGSKIIINLESHLLSEDSELDETRKIRDNVAVNCEESFVFTSPERLLLLGYSEPHNAGKQEQKEEEFKDDSAFHTWLQCLFPSNSCEVYEDIFKTIGKVSSHIEVAEMVSGGSCCSTDIENRPNDAHEALAMDGNNEDELMEANLFLDLSGYFSVSEKTCDLARTEDEHLGDEVTSPLATAFEEAIAQTLDEFTIQHNSNEEA